MEKQFVTDVTKHGYRNCIRYLLERVSGNKYNLTISIIPRFDIIVQFVGNGQYFQQAFQFVLASRDLEESANYSGVTETIVHQNAKAMIVIDLHLLQNLICDLRCWAFSIVFDATFNREDAYLDIRICSVFHGGVSNVHFIAVSLHDLHIELLIVEVVAQVLRAVFENYRKNKLVFIATDRASNVTAKVQGALTRFQQVCLPRYFCIWYANHQFDLVFKAVTKIVVEHSFRTKLVLLISYLRRQNTLRFQIRSTCPTARQTRWLSLGSSTTWPTRR